MTVIAELERRTTCNRYRTRTGKAMWRSAPGSTVARACLKAAALRRVNALYYGWVPLPLGMLAGFHIRAGNIERASRAAPSLFIVEQRDARRACRRGRKPGGAGWTPFSQRMRQRQRKRMEQQ